MDVLNPLSCNSINSNSSLLSCINPVYLTMNNQTESYALELQNEDKFQISKNIHDRDIENIQHDSHTQERNNSKNADTNKNSQNSENNKVILYPYFLCDYCKKISDTCYFCYNKECNFNKKIQQFLLYNQPNNLTLDEIVSHCEDNYIYEENIDNFNRIYDPYVTRCKINDVFINGKKIKKDHPGFCKYCILSDSSWDSNFYERNNSRYRGHMINTHGIHPFDIKVKIPDSGVFCYKWVRNHWFETSGFFCPYENCNKAFAIGEKSHGFHEYLRHWNKFHIVEESNNM